MHFFVHYHHQLLFQNFHPIEQFFVYAFFFFFLFFKIISFFTIHPPTKEKNHLVDILSHTNTHFCDKHIVNMLNAIQSTGPALQIEVVSPEIRGEGSKRYVDYTVKVQTTLAIFEQNESVVHRRYSEFEWLHNELEQSDTKMVVPPLPEKAWQRQLPFRRNSNFFQDDFIEERRRGLETFINKIATHPLAQNERALHFFLFEPEFDLTKYVRGKMRH